ncbi:MAG: 2,3-bisphosphoglycerate-independent phosphoglycerate mutase [Candidatus Kerfeldbacteria bacterium CG_4_10_14_0_8_um_filter_42_10]|uniref:2,3-bisphosphoglycerate-independent phosphoglycerate mutase n=1 Tax=Candidatus Kerfeldbacteria bacterium CG_4_10_14_0_8_um_filter_42_10 TaxID=2014248 RepID=A0A2M7RG35_9BACT|nr:MAG: 2,3-bisphosphoglycerate-independent phosphoglycerate mutase [Candidatus Kerfeldbacteria bacterium CG_4_10_14_0_8_um_filter_42_10]
MTPHFVTLIIIDGFGIAPPRRGNAVSLANTPFFDKLVTTYPTMALQSSGEMVGLPWGEMGNSEVGHLSLGTGRIVYQYFPRITKAIADGSFFKKDAFLKVIQHVKKNKSALHLMGLVSDGGVHSSSEHLYALLELCKDSGLEKVFVHAFLDGRDAPRDSAEDFIQQLLKRIGELRIGKIASLSGRYYAMDRDNHWDRVAKAYWAISEGESKSKVEDPVKAIRESYAQEVYDEEFPPAVITENGQPVCKVEENDGIIFFNFRPDRARQLTKTFILPGFEKIKRPRAFRNLFFVSMTEYEKDLPVGAVAFPPEEINYSLAKVISDRGLKQLHIAETEKYPHVTFFFNGGKENAFTGEDRALVSSPNVSSYDQKPEMSSRELKEKIVAGILNEQYQLIVANFANADMVGHTGNLKATVQAVESIDSCLKEIVEATLDKGGVAIITADHGNAEEVMKAQTGEIDKEHSNNPVPFVLIGKNWEGQNTLNSRDLSVLRPMGILADVAPTILKIMGIAKPAEMTGRSLI